MSEDQDGAGSPVDALRVARSLGTVTISPEEHPDDKALRLAIAGRAALIGHVQDFIIFLLIVAGLGFLAWVAYREAFEDPTASPDTKRWALAVLTSVVTGGVSFIAGRRIGSK